MKNLQFFNALYETARHEFSSRYQIARLGREDTQDAITCRVWIQPHTPRRLHPDELLHVAQEFAQALAKALDADMQVTREDANTFSLRFSEPQPEVFGEYHPAPAFTGKPAPRPQESTYGDYVCDSCGAAWTQFGDKAKKH